MRNRVIHRNSPFRLLAAALAVLTLTLLAVMVPCEGEAHAAAPIKIACVGDSLTDGSKSSGGKKGDTAYPAWLGRILGSGYDVRNFGAAGDTLLRGTGWSYWDSAEFRQSKEFAPDIVIIMLGTNDSMERDTVQDRGEGAGEGVPGSRQPTGRVFREFTALIPGRPRYQIYLRQLREQVTSRTGVSDP